MQTHDNNYGTQTGWVDDGHSFFNGNAIIHTKVLLKDWAMVVVFSYPVVEVEVIFG